MLFNKQGRTRWTRPVAVLLALALVTCVLVESLTPDDCESKYHRLKVGMTAPEVGSVMSRKNYLRGFFTQRQRLRRAGGVDPHWAEMWYEGGGELIGVHLEWDAEGRLARKAICKGGRWDDS